MNRKSYIVFFAVVFFVTGFYCQPTWNYSGAPIGNSSTFRYNTVSGLSSVNDSLVLQHPSGQDSLKIFKIKGNPPGVHIYRVDQLPNTQCGLPGLLTNDRYFGVFVVSNSSASSYSWQAKYYYNGSPYVNAVNEPFLELYKRANNSSVTCPAWGVITPASTIGTAGDTITTAIQAIKRMELILTFNPVVLPITIKEFKAIWTDGLKNSATIMLNVNSDLTSYSYEVEKMMPSGNWETIASFNNAANGTYEYYDKNIMPLNYYRLKCINLATSQIELSNIVMLEQNQGREGEPQTYPNPVSDNYHIKINSKGRKVLKYSVITCTGQLLKSFSQLLNEGENDVVINVEDLSAGVYMLSARIEGDNDSVFYKKIIKN